MTVADLPHRFWIGLAVMVAGVLTAVLSALLTDEEKDPAGTIVASLVAAFAGFSMACHAQITSMNARIDFLETVTRDHEAAHVHWNRVGDAGTIRSERRD